MVHDIDGFFLLMDSRPHIQQEQKQKQLADNFENKIGIGNRHGAMIFCSAAVLTDVSVNQKDDGACHGVGGKRKHEAPESVAGFQYLEIGEIDGLACAVAGVVAGGAGEPCRRASGETVAGKVPLEIDLVARLGLHHGLLDATLVGKQMVVGKALVHKLQLGAFCF